MPIAPVAKLTKQQIVWLGTHRCEQHGHVYLQHYNCFLKEQKPNERIGFLDIESSNLQADYGIILSYCIKDSLSDEILFDTVSKDDLFTSKPGKEDKRLVKNLIKDLEKFDKVVTYYGSRFDLPFIRTRAAVNKIPFPTYGALTHIDLWFTVKGKFRISSNRLENACRVILGKTNKTRITSAYWAGAMRGDEDAMKYVLEHNKYDVVDLEALYNKIEEFRRPAANSI